VNAWLAAALVLLAGAAPLCVVGVASGRPVRRLAALTLLSTVVGAVLLVLPQGYDRPSYQDMALVLGVLAPAGTLVFTRFAAGPDRPPDGHGNPGEPGRQQDRQDRQDRQDKQDGRDG
jgi:multisubunit Na+/H+ antiporter MnhF subunit